MVTIVSTYPYRVVAPGGKATKAAVSYSLGEKNSHCGKSFEGDTGFCRYFQAPPQAEITTGTCQKVEGQIRRIDWCKLWTRVQSR